jgi:hypothetical protein
LSKRFRALKLWFVIRNYGITGLQKHIREVRLGFFSFEKLFCNSFPFIFRKTLLTLFSLLYFSFAKLLQFFSPSHIRFSLNFVSKSLPLLHFSFSRLLLLSSTLYFFVSPSNIRLSQNSATNSHCLLTFFFCKTSFTTPFPFSDFSCTRPSTLFPLSQFFCRTLLLFSLFLPFLCKTPSAIPFPFSHSSFPMLSFSFHILLLRDSFYFLLPFLFFPCKTPFAITFHFIF